MSIYDQMFDNPDSFIDEDEIEVEEYADDETVVKLTNLNLIRQTEGCPTIENLIIRLQNLLEELELLEEEGYILAAPMTEGKGNLFLEVEENV